MNPHNTFKFTVARKIAERAYNTFLMTEYRTYTFTNTPHGDIHVLRFGDFYEVCQVQTDKTYRIRIAKVWRTRLNRRAKLSDIS